MTTTYWDEYLARDEEQQEMLESQPTLSRHKTRDYTKDQDDQEYVHMTLVSGEPVRFKRTWGQYRFTDQEVEQLKAGMEIRIQPDNIRGAICGGLDWQEYKGYDYYGFAPWDASIYRRENAPMPCTWNGYTFTAEEEQLLRKGQKLLIVTTSKKTGNAYALHVSFQEGDGRWVIHPHFEEFKQPAAAFTRETCLFNPVFGGALLPHHAIAAVRKGQGVYYKGVGRNGSPYHCQLFLQLERGRWQLVPQFNQ